MSRIDVLGVSFDDLTMDEAVEIALGFMQERRACYACTPNPEIVMAAKGDAALRAALSGAEANFTSSMSFLKSEPFVFTIFPPGTDATGPCLCISSLAHPESSREARRTEKITVLFTVISDWKRRSGLL